MSTATLIKPTEVKEGTFTVDGRAFAETVALVAKAAGKPTRTYTPLVVLAFKNQRVTVSATNFEQTISIKLPVKGRKAAVVAVEAAKLVTFTKALAAETAVEIVTAQDEVLVQAGDTVYHLPPVSDFYKVDQPDPVDPQPLDLAGFVKAVRIAGAAASTDLERPTLTGISFCEGTAAATDSYRLAVTYDAPADLNGLIPAVAARLAAATFGADEEVTFELANGRHLVFRSATKTVSIRVIDGAFPNYAQLIRGVDTYKVLAPRGQLVAALDKVRLASAAGAFPVKLVVEGTNLHLSVTPHDMAHAHDDVDLIASDVGVPVIGMNPELIVQLLKAVAGVDNIEFGYADSHKPVNITDGSAVPSWRMLLMPVRMPDSTPVPKSVTP